MSSDEVQTSVDHVAAATGPAEPVPPTEAPIESTPEVHAAAAPAPAEPAAVSPLVAEAAASAPATEVPADPAAVDAPAAAEVAPDAERPRRRVELNPTIDPQKARPVPAPSLTEDAVTIANETARSVPMVVPSGPVELPPAHANLPAELEAQVEAALEAGLAAATPAATPPAPPTDAPAGLMVATIGSEDELQSGLRLKAKVQTVSDDNVFLEIGLRSPAILPTRQFPQGKHPKPGEEFLVVVDKYDADQGLVHVSLPKATRRVKGNWEELQVGQIVDAYVTKTNKGGLDVAVGQMRAFLPASQIDLGFVESAESYVGRKFPVQITEVNAAKRNLVVSRRMVLIAERKELAGQFWQKVDIGQQYQGTVKTIKDYGAFIDLGGVDGFLHIGEMSWSRVKHPSELLKEGMSIEVVVLSLDREKQKIGLGMRQLSTNPWANIEQRYQSGQVVTGKVTRIADFGAFVELEQGVEGLVHVSELDYRRVKSVGEVLKAGQETQVQVLEVNLERQRISLSLKAMKPKPEQPKDEDLSPSKGQAYERKRKEPLRGGTGSNTGSGLFGNPNDFRG